jgi:hypothetical protein
MAARPGQDEMGSGGQCVCPRCGTEIRHRRGVPCQDEDCPECGAKILREGSQHHRLWRARQEERTSGERGHEDE